MFELHSFQKITLKALEAPPTQQAHVICVSPTGSGKSLIYERAALAQSRRTLLITPLVALARQQFASLQRGGVSVKLGAGGETHHPPPRSGAWIVSPEILQFPSKQAALKQWRPNFLVVDECHCLWEWGENFRPAFQLIPSLLSKYSIPHSLWLTATLPFEARLSLRKCLPPPTIEIGRFDLPYNLYIEIQRIPLEDRVEFLLKWVLRKSGAGIIFVSTREGTLRLGRLLEATGKKVLIYHGGMSKEERKNAETLVSNKIPDIIVATSAFGMGMNYLYLTYVVLWQTPTSLLSLVQIMGRVGRKKERDEHALILWDRDDFHLLEWTVQRSKKHQKELEDLLGFLKGNICRRYALIQYFEQTEGPLSCEKCDICLGLKKD